MSHSQDELPLAPLSELELIPQEEWRDYIKNRNPNLPYAANVAIHVVGRASREEFLSKVSPAWSSRCRDLAAKLNATAVVIVQQGTSQDSVLAPMEAEVSLAMAGDNVLAGLWLLVTVLFSEGVEATNYFFAALEAAARLNSTRVSPLNIPAPAEYWQNPSWHEPRAVMTLLLALSSPAAEVRSAMAVLSRSFGTPDPDIARMDREPSASLREAYDVARKEARDSGNTTVFGVDLVDKGLTRFNKETPGSQNRPLSFRRMFVVGICPKGVKIWQAGGDGFQDTLKEQNDRQGPGMLEEKDVEQFMADFDRLVSGGKVGVMASRFSVDSNN